MSISSMAPLIQIGRLPRCQLIGEKGDIRFISVLRIRLERSVNSLKCVAHQGRQFAAISTLWQNTLDGIRGNTESIVDLLKGSSESAATSTYWRKDIVEIGTLPQYQRLAVIHSLSETLPTNLNLLKMLNSAR